MKPPPLHEGYTVDEASRATQWMKPAPLQEGYIVDEASSAAGGLHSG